MQNIVRFATQSVAFNRRLKTSFMVLAIACCVYHGLAVSSEAQAPIQSATPVAPAHVPTAEQDSQRTMVNILVKNALLAVNQGNLTGNYTVLRDLASPGFREKNSAADLAAIFQGIRQQKIDLSPIVALEPVLNPPRVTADGQVMLDGYFEAQQMRINFQLIFLKAASNGWMIHGVSLNAVPLGPAAVTANANLQPPFPDRQ